MPLSIRDPRAAELARELAGRRGTNMTEAIVSALQAALEAGGGKPALSGSLTAIADDLAKRAGPRRRKMKKAEVDAMWGH